jgi:hypothetical protein
MDFGARMSLIIHLESLNEYMALAALISSNSLHSSKPSVLSSSKIRKEIIGFGKKNLFWDLVPCVVVAFVSKFHPIWCPIAQESRL